MDLRQRVVEAWPGLNQDAVARVVRFQDLLARENEVQNLTRLIEPKDFVEGHFQDVVELARSGLVSYPALDLGSGCGVPGLLSACASENEWLLVDSEARKADFLQRAVSDLGLGHVKVKAGRAEAVLKAAKVESVVARAVGPVLRIYPWIRKCSTWNTLVLLKGPGWDAEWADFLGSSYKKELRIESTHEYRVGADQKVRKIIRLARVPRGT
jgi:16S rRNA (guanine527-N7)-methyltransferase